MAKKVYTKKNLFNIYKKVAKLQKLYNSYTEKVDEIDDDIKEVEGEFTALANEGNNYQFFTENRIGDIFKSKSSSIKYVCITGVEVSIDWENKIKVTFVLNYIDHNGKTTAKEYGCQCEADFKRNFRKVKKVGKDTIPLSIKIKEIKEIEKKDRDIIYLITAKDDSLYVITAWHKIYNSYVNTINLMDKDYRLCENNKKGNSIPIKSIKKIRTELQYNKLIESLL